MEYRFLAISELVVYLWLITYSAGNDGSIVWSPLNYSSTIHDVIVLCMYIIIMCLYIIMFMFSQFSSLSSVSHFRFCAANLPPNWVWDCLLESFHLFDVFEWTTQQRVGFPHFHFYSHWLLWKFTAPSWLLNLVFVLLSFWSVTCLAPSPLLIFFRVLKCIRTSSFRSWHLSVFSWWVWGRAYFALYLAVWASTFQMSK